MLAPGRISCGSASMHALEGAEVPAKSSSHVRLTLHGNTSNLSHTQCVVRGKRDAEYWGIQSLWHAV